MAGKWGIEKGSGWFEHEEERIARSATAPVSAVASEDAVKTLLVDHRGRPLLVSRPRRIGFRPPA